MSIPADSDLGRPGRQILVFLWTCVFYRQLITRRDRELAVFVQVYMNAGWKKVVVDGATNVIRRKKQPAVRLWVDRRVSEQLD
jgi:hypothetical protein